MRPSRNVPVAIAVVALGLALGLSLAGPTATAAADAWNAESAYLRFPSSPGFRDCAERRIFLKRGEYRWRLFTVHWAHANDPNWSPGRWLRLRRGDYRWVDCLVYTTFPNLHGPDHEVYGHVSKLYELATGGNPAVKRWSEWGRPYGDGSYDFGSALLWTDGW